MLKRSARWLVAVVGWQLRMNREKQTRSDYGFLVIVMA
jgi:hypothetical protein